MKLSTSSDGSGLVKLPAYHSIVEVVVNGTPTTTGFTASDNLIQFSPIPPVGYSLVITINEVVHNQVVEAPSYTQRVDVASSTITYVGEANAGSSESSPVWRIKKLLSNPEGDTDIFFATGNAKFNQKWTERASLSYS